MENFIDVYSRQEKTEEEKNEKKIIKFDSENWSEQDKRAFEVINIIKGIEEGSENGAEKEGGVEAFIAGGAARDYLRGGRPNDIDICTSCQPREIEKQFANMPNYTCYYVGKSKEHKIINIRYKDEDSEYNFEVATFRKDIYLSEDVSEKIKNLESAGFSKRLIEFNEDYEDLKDEFEQDKDSDYSFASAETVSKIFGKDNFVSETDQEGVFRIITGDEDLKVAFFKKIDKQEDQGEPVKEKVQKHVSGRHPDFVKTKGVSAREDAMRRDFTMNGVYYDPVKKEMVDYVGGFEDIKNEIIRFTGDPGERIEQDKIRILRFFRFKNILGLKADERSLKAIKAWIADEENQKEFRNMFELNQRIKPEFGKILKSGKRVEILEELMEEKVLGLMIPEIAKMKGVEQPKEFHEEGDVWEHTKKCLEKVITYQDYKKKFSAYDLQKIKREYLEFPKQDQEALLPLEEYVNVCKSRNIKADEDRYSRIAKKWQGKMPSKEEYIDEFINKKPEDVEREYLELVWAVLLHDSGKVDTQVFVEEAGVETINFNKHEKSSVDIAKYILLIEKEAKWHRGEGLNVKGERLKGLNYESDFTESVLWLVSNHMHHIDFSRMSKTKQERLMENENFKMLLELWKADVLGSIPVRIEDCDEAEKIYEEYSKRRIDESASSKKEKIINPGELMRIMEREKLEIRGGILKHGAYAFPRAIPIIIDYLENRLLDKDMAEKKVIDLIGKEKVFEKIDGLIEEDPEIKKLKKELKTISEKNRAKEIKKINAQIGRKANEIFGEYFEKLNIAPTEEDPSAK